MISKSNIEITGLPSSVFSNFLILLLEGISREVLGHISTCPRPHLKEDIVDVVYVPTILK